MTKVLKIIEKFVYSVKGEIKYLEHENFLGEKLPKPLESVMDFKQDFVAKNNEDLFKLIMKFGEYMKGENFITFEVTKMEQVNIVAESFYYE